MSLTMHFLTDQDLNLNRPLGTVIGTEWTLPKRWCPRPGRYRISVGLFSHPQPWGLMWNNQPTFCTPLPQPWQNYYLVLAVPRNALIWPVKQWAEISPSSDMLYVFRWRPTKRISLIGQIATPDSRSTPHYHKATRESVVGAHPVGTGTFLCTPKRVQELSCRPVPIRLGSRHQLIRPGGGCSFQLLRCEGPVLFPDRRDHFDAPFRHRFSEVAAMSG